MVWEVVLFKLHVRVHVVAYVCATKNITQFLKEVFSPTCTYVHCTCTHTCTCVCTCNGLHVDSTNRLCTHHHVHVCEGQAGCVPC